MFERLKRLHEQGRIDTAGIDKAVSNGWITPEQAALILG